ncbi:GOLM1 protein, partial [Eubucco bourcierii]|nr:GOLM1 protein [Eubucco bourcierii]
MKSPPLLVAALVACIIVLGLNYWIASSRSVDLQGRIMALEGKVRRAAAERGAVELKKNEFQGELEKQRQQIDKIQSLHNYQMENAKRVHQEEKAVLMSNITVNERLIQGLRGWKESTLQGQGLLKIEIYKQVTVLKIALILSGSQCINQMKELKEQCEERIDELRKKGSDAPQIKGNKSFSEDLKKPSQVIPQVPAVMQTEVKQVDVEQQKLGEDVPKVVPAVKKTDSLQTKGKINNLADIRNQEHKAEEEEVSSQLKNPQDLLKPAAVHKEILPESQKELNSPEDEKHVTRQETLQVAEGQTASEEVEREDLLNDDAKQDDLTPGKAEKYEDEALKEDKDIDYHLDENEAESEVDKQAALAGIENGEKKKENI